MRQLFERPLSESRMKSIKIPTDVRKEALKAFALRDRYGFAGATETGWARAKQLAYDSHISIEDLTFMRNWYARHIYTSYPGYLKWVAAGSQTTKEAARNRAVNSWLTWGGDAGLKWVNHINKQGHFLKQYTNISLFA